MESPDANNLAAVLTSVSSYGEQLASVFHNYVLSKDVVPFTLEGAVTILDTTVTTLKQLLGLVENGTGVSGLSDTENRPFNDVGLKYVSILALETAKNLAKIGPILEEACLGRTERKALVKQRRKTPLKKPFNALDALSLTLDAKALLGTIEKSSWTIATRDLQNILPRLHEIQLWLLLVYQVATVGALSRDV